MVGESESNWALASYGWLLRMDWYACMYNGRAAAQTFFSKRVGLRTSELRLATETATRISSVVRWITDHDGVYFSIVVRSPVIPPKR